MPPCHVRTRTVWRSMKLPQCNQFLRPCLRGFDSGLYPQFLHAPRVHGGLPRKGYLKMPSFLFLEYASLDQFQADARLLGVPFVFVNLYKHPKESLKRPVSVPSWLLPLFFSFTAFHKGNPDVLLILQGESPRLGIISRKSSPMRKRNTYTKYYFIKCRMRDKTRRGSSTF